MADKPTAVDTGTVSATRLTHVGRAGTRTLGFVNPPVQRGSTLLHPDMEAFAEHGRVRLQRGLTYGTHGSATHHSLEDAVAAIEGGTRCQILPTGLAAVTLALLAFLDAGDHALIPDSVYGPARRFCNATLARLQIAVTFYEPLIAPDDLATLFQPNTKVLYIESPGSHTFEIQDVPALAARAHARGATVLMDNTWGVHSFQPFRHGVDVSIQALTKYIAGHSDVLLGSITVATDEAWARIRENTLLFGLYASPDDCWFALRGVRTLAVRLDRHMRSALAVATWLAARPEVRTVLYPALPGAPGHDLWTRDFTGGCGLFGVEFQPAVTDHALNRMIESLRLFGIGESWGGFESLAIPSLPLTRTYGTPAIIGPLCRLHIGLEEPADLIADLEQAFAISFA